MTLINPHEEGGRERMIQRGKRKIIDKKFKVNRR